MDEKRIVAERLSNVSLTQEAEASEEILPPTPLPISPTTAVPTTPELTTTEPTAEPTTAEPTAAEPTAAEPTAAEPTAAEPTTAEPTAAEPTTAEPTTTEITAEPITVGRTTDPSPSLDQTFRTFESLSLNFKANVAKLASVAPTEPLLSSSDEEEDRVYRVMTKAQNQLTTDESKVWGKIATSMSMYTNTAGSTASLDFPISTINDINTLADKSFVMSTSFLRRTQTPTDQTYRESKEILQAMGIQCIDAADATEAEALASAIVHQGLADFVVTEDTVRKQHLR